MWMRGCARAATGVGSNPGRQSVTLILNCDAKWGLMHALTQVRSIVYNKVVTNTLLRNKKKDHAFEDLMDMEKKLRIMQKIVSLITKNPERRIRYLHLAGRGRDVGVHKPRTMTDFLDDKYTRILEVYRDPLDEHLYVRLAPPILQLLEEEKRLKEELVSSAATRLRKVLMMCAERKAFIRDLEYLKPDLGLPDDFCHSVVGRFPEHFVFEEGPEGPLVKIVSWDDSLAIPAIEKFREEQARKKLYSEEEKQRNAYAFPIQFPPGLRLKKGYRAKVKRWQEIPYIGPYQYDNPSHGSPEALKRASAIIHEYLHITVEKRTKVERISRLRSELHLPQKIGVTVLNQPGIFYFSTKGKGQTIFLREAYHKGELKEFDPLLAIKEKFMKLIRMRNKKYEDDYEEDFQG